MITKLDVNVFGPLPVFSEQDIADLSAILTHPALHRLMQFHLHNEWAALVGRNPIITPADELRQHFAYMKGVEALARNLTQPMSEASYHG